MKKLKTYATSISWETDKESVDLPVEVLIPASYSETDDEIADYLSNTYGWLVSNFIRIKK